MKMERCLSLLKSSKSDNEKFAALLLVVKSIKSDEVEGTVRRKIFDNVGFSFINRLLLTTTVPEGCNENVYRSLALTLLACFSTDEELVNHPQLIQKIPVFVEALSDSQLSTGQVNDVLQCISAQAGSPRGSLLLLKCGALEALGARYISGCSDCVEILIQLVAADWTGSNLSVFIEHFIHLMGKLSVVFAANQDTFKFDLLSVLISIWTSVRLENGGSCSYEACTNWLKPAATGLRDILQSRVDADKRISALQFASLLTQQFSLQWTFLTEINKSKSSLLLLIQLVSVEVHLTLDGQSMEQVLPHSNLLSSCFTVMEHCVVLISSSTQKDRENDLTEEDLLQLHSSLREGLSYVVKFFREIEDKGPTISSLMTQPLVLAAIRVLGAWLAEDSLSLSEDVHKILPFLVRLAGVHPEEGAVWGDGDVMKFILPGFCQLISEDVPRAVLIQSKFHVVLQKYLDSLVNELSTQKSVEDGALERCLLSTSIFQTICICESDLVRHEVTFLCVLENICHLLRCRGLSLELTINLAFLAILIIRRKGSLHEAGVLKQKPFVSTVLDIVVQCCEYSQTKESQMQTLWSIVSEPSLLLLQEMTVLLQTDEGFREAVSLNSSHISTFRTTLTLKSGKSMDDISEKLEDFLAQLQS